MSVEHRNIPAHGVHIPHAFKTADLNTLVVTALDIDKLALLTTDNTYHKLTSVEPAVWTKMTLSTADIKAVTHSIDEVTGLQTALDGKVDKVVGKGLSTNDLTNELLTLLTTNKVKSIATDALNGKLVVTYTDDTVANLNINDIVTDVYVSGATLDVTTNVLTLTSTSGGADVTVNLSDFVNSSELTSALAPINTSILELDTEKASTSHNHTGTYEPADATILKDVDIGSTVQGYNANTTAAGNTFNGANQLVQLNGTGGLPAIDGSQLTGLSSGVTDHTGLTNIGTKTHAQLESDIAAKVSGAVFSANAVHTIINDNSWIFNEDGTVTGALQIEITGLYSQTLSGMMKIMITQNGSAEEIYPDYDMLIGGAWRASDHTWHNTKASMDTIAATGLNVRFAHNGSQVFMLIGDTSTVWNYPRLVIREIVSNSIIGGYIPDFTITRATSYPATVDSNLAISSALLKTGGNLTGAVNNTQIDKGTVSTGTVTFTQSAGNVQRLQVGGALTIAVSGWATTGIFSDILLRLVNAGSAMVTLPTINWIKPDGTLTTTFATYLTAIARPALQTSGVDFMYLFTLDAGTTVYGKLL